MLNQWNYFLNKYCNLPFLANWYFPTCPFDISCVILISKSKDLASNGLSKMINYHIIVLYKTTCYKKKPKFFQFFFFSLTASEVFWLFPYQSICKFLIISLSSSFEYKNGENLKMLTEIFCQKLIVSNVILVFPDHLKPKIFYVGLPW